MSSAGIARIRTVKPIQSLKQTARKAILRNFILRESPSSLSANSPSSTVPSSFSSLSNPFAPTKTVGANSSTPPKYSLRRQKVLRQQAEILGWPSNVLPAAYLPHPSPSDTLRAKRSPGLHRESRNIPATKVLTALKLEKKGPYIGRKGPAFKGKMWERKMDARVEELRVALEATGLKEATWRKVRSVVIFFLPIAPVSLD